MIQLWAELCHQDFNSDMLVTVTTLTAALKAEGLTAETEALEAFFAEKVR